MAESRTTYTDIDEIPMGVRVQVSGKCQLMSLMQADDHGVRGDKYLCSPDKDVVLVEASGSIVRMFWWNCWDPSSKNFMTLKFCFLGDDGFVYIPYKGECNFVRIP